MRKQGIDPLARLRQVKEGKKPLDVYEDKDDSVYKSVNDEEYDEIRKSNKKQFLEHGEDYDEDALSYEEDGEDVYEDEERPEKKQKKSKKKEIELAPPSERLPNFFQKLVCQRQEKNLVESDFDALDLLDANIDAMDDPQEKEVDGVIDTELATPTETIEGLPTPKHQLPTPSQPEQQLPTPPKPKQQLPTPPKPKQELPTPANDPQLPTPICMPESKKRSDNDRGASDNSPPANKRQKLKNDYVVEKKESSEMLDVKFDSRPAKVVGKQLPPPSSAGILNFFLLDIDEDPAGVSLYLFGKISDGDKYKSCCIVVKQIERQIYVHPRHPPPPTTDGVPCHEDPEICAIANSVIAELADVRQTLGTVEFLFRPVRRNYTFERLGMVKGKDLLFVKCSYSSVHPPFPSNVTEGRTFSHVFGSDASLSELFLIKRKIMGPCWLSISNWKSIEHFRVSNCVYEVQIESPKSVVVMKDTVESPVLPMPPLTVMSFGFHYSIGSSNALELAMAGCCWGEIASDLQTIGTLNCSIGVRLLQSTSAWPRGWQEKCRSTSTQTFQSENLLFHHILDLTSNVDPDILMGHSVSTSDFDRIADRLRIHKIPTWSKLSRLQRPLSRLQQLGRFTSNRSGFGVGRQLTLGRLVCDTSQQCRDILRARASFDLPSLVSDLFPSESPPPQFSPDCLASVYSDGSQLSQASDGCLFEAKLAVRLAVHLKMLGLSKELSTLSGCPWQWSLQCRRADRNDFLLLHRFHQHKCVAPDRVKRKKEEILEDEEELGKKKKAAYSGGLVLEPKSGLYDTFILLLDFNSLYPSIIQEYNICFTTFEWDKEGETTAVSAKPGVLPAVLKNLVERRRQVKKAIKQCTSSSQKDSLEIRQLALKLTANSMYGCLGYQFSRFFARPLAALITRKGRELLEATKTKVESDLRLNVIYGDTDSLMIDSGLLDDGAGVNYQKAIGMAEQIKKLINSPTSQLELELDGVFWRLLLLMKKKYACVKVIDYDKKLFEQENKGLDIVRRDWCGLTKMVGNQILQILFNQELSVDAVVEQLHDLLRSTNEKLSNESIPLELFTITKALTKMPEHYSDAKQHPHVQVAKRMQTLGRPIRPGVEIQYIICKDVPSNNEENLSNRTVPDRAYHAEEVTAQGLKVDIDWYKTTQLLPPIGRLCQHVAGTSLARLAECLGLSGSQYVERVAAAVPAPDLPNTEEGDSFFVNNDEELSSLLHGFEVLCNSCGKMCPAANVFKTLQCPECNVPIPSAILKNWISRTMHRLVDTHGRFAQNCSECPTGVKTSRVSILAPHRCMHASCPNPAAAMVPVSVPIHSFSNQLRTLLAAKKPEKHLEPLLATVRRFSEMDKKSKIGLQPLFNLF